MTHSKREYQKYFSFATKYLWIYFIRKFCTNNFFSEEKWQQSSTTITNSMPFFLFRVNLYCIIHNKMNDMKDLYRCNIYSIVYRWYFPFPIPETNKHSFPIQSISVPMQIKPCIRWKCDMQSRELTGLTEWQCFLMGF